MNYDIVGKGGPPKVAFLCPRLEPGAVTKHYHDPYLKEFGQEVMVCDLFMDKTKKKTSAGDIKEYLNDLLPHLLDAGIEMLIVTQPDYFKVITKQGKTDATCGDILEGVGGFKVAYCPNYSRLFIDPDKVQNKIDIAMRSVVRSLKGDNTKAGSDIIRFKHYPQTDDEKIEWLGKLLQMDCDLTCDIEGFDLKHHSCGIGTITFCWNQHEGVAFSIDYNALGQPVNMGDIRNKALTYGESKPNPRVRAALKSFFERFKQKMIYHNICFDAYVLIYQLFMDHILDQEGLLEGLKVMLRDWDCSQLITYLATNSCAGNELGLKAQAQEFAGNYAQSDIHDITLIPEPQLLEYNLVDGLSTWYVLNKHKPTMIADDQSRVYYELFKPAVVDIIQMQLTGLPVNMKKVVALNDLLQKESDDLLKRMNETSIVMGYMDVLMDELVVAKNAKLKTKQITRADLGQTKDTTIAFNPNSAPQLQRLLYDEEFLGLPILDYTKSKQPGTGAETLEKLVKQQIPKEVKEFLEILLEFKASAIILSTFLPAFLQAYEGNDGWHYLFGNFRLGGTLSGRLSSNNPNLQNIPSSAGGPLKSRLAKLIKECFEAPPGWLFCGLDFDSLEDKISAVTTRDPEKIKVYSDGYDGHSIRALAYFPDQMPDIELCPEGAKAYKAMIGGQEIFFHSEEEIEYLGKPMTGQALFSLLNQER